MTPPHIKTYSTSIRFPIDLRPRIQAAAAAESRRPTDWIREAVRTALVKAEAKRRRLPKPKLPPTDPRPPRGRSVEKRVSRNSGVQP